MARWDALDGMVDALRDANPDADPRAMADDELRALARRLPDFDEGGGDGSAGDIEALRAMWHWGV